MIDNSLKLSEDLIFKSKVRKSKKCPANARHFLL